MGTRIRQALSSGMPLLQVNFWTDLAHREAPSRVQVGAYCPRTSAEEPVLRRRLWSRLHSAVLTIPLSCGFAFARLGIQEVRGFVPGFLATARSPFRFGSFNTSSIGNVREKDEMEGITVSRDGEMIGWISVTTPPQTTMWFRGSEAKFARPHTPARQGISEASFRKSLSVPNVPIYFIAQKTHCLVDSGSADLWVPSTACRTHRISQQVMLESVQFQPQTVSYGIGEVQGFDAEDRAEVGPIAMDKQPSSSRNSRSSLYYGSSQPVPRETADVLSSTALGDLPSAFFL